MDIGSREYMQGKIKKEAAIACAASAIRLCALITHLVLTLFRECNGPQISDWKLYIVQDIFWPMLIYCFYHLCLDGGSSWMDGTSLNWGRVDFDSYQKSFIFSVLNLLSRGTDFKFLKNCFRLGIHKVSEKMGLICFYWLCSHWDVDTFCLLNK